MTVPSPQFLFLDKEKIQIEPGRVQWVIMASSCIDADWAPDDSKYEM